MACLFFQYSMGKFAMYERNGVARVVTYIVYCYRKTCKAYMKIQ